MDFAGLHAVALRGQQRCLDHGGWWLGGEDPGRVQGGPEIEPSRMSVIWWSGPRGWEHTVQHDEWGDGNPMPDAQVRGRFGISPSYGDQSGWNQFLQDCGQMCWFGILLKEQMRTKKCLCSWEDRLQL